MRKTRRRSRLFAGALVVAVTAALLTAPAGQAAPAATALPVADDGARVVAETWIDSRTLDLTIETPALARTTSTAMVRLLLPTGWARNATRTWPILYLLHGCCEEQEYRSWTTYTDVEQFTADKQAIIVMPSAGRIGMYSKWWNYGLSDKPDWPTFHVTELLQLLERGYRAGTRRAIAGLSMGGYGAMEYASRFPGTFGAAASYSGAIDVLMPPIPEVTQLNMVAQGHFVWGVLWGDPWSQRARWRDHNPADKIDRLRGTKLYVSSGNGNSGPLDNPDAPEAVGELLESVALVNSQLFTGKLLNGGVPVITDYYGAGTHTWPYWESTLKRSWPVLADGMGI